METEESWVFEQLDYLFYQSKDYKQKAIISGMKDLIEEQITRKEQIQGELDGTLWSPQNWEE